jgi:hypothetical protein
MAQLSTYTVETAGSSVAIKPKIVAQMITRQAIMNVLNHLCICYRPSRR